MVRSNGAQNGIIWELTGLYIQGIIQNGNFIHVGSKYNCSSFYGEFNGADHVFAVLFPLSNRKYIFTNYW